MNTAFDPMAPTRNGWWCADGIRVRRRSGSHRCGGHRRWCTPRFCVHRGDVWLTVEHDVRPDELSDELAVLLVADLIDGGALRGRSEFEAVFTGVVRSTVDGALPAWLRFYRNSLALLESGAAAFAPVHARAQTLVAGNRVVDLGSCFGFFPLRLARHGFDVVATDLSGPAMHLLDLAAAALQRPVHTARCDAAAVPLPDHCADTVTALHLLEHLDDHTIDAALGEALRLARRRVVVAVPMEDRPRECYGHIQRFDLTRLQQLGARWCPEFPGLTATVDEFHGGWLILDL
ncbi:mycofactocin oligosaccharide methyltransferase MftM [Mycolicibacterium tokaiense]|uniref:mycofactocin oligosaccharide methyltransferase MftM n=1 Tax=Mycolicibacterium tokaiense TaxID=39695 RepID=UPI000E1C17D6|nr:mycofactocin oligosaccharide methyltransferase MftM [Mycolicibacterium tokaiense]BBY86223.1 SAM-dependent methyltransferase [Mycolicibacterium tokaiense]